VAIAPCALNRPPSQSHRPDHEPLCSAHRLYRSVTCGLGMIPNNDALTSTDPKTSDTCRHVGIIPINESRSSASANERSQPPSRAEDEQHPRFAHLPCISTIADPPVVVAQRVKFLPEFLSQMRAH